MQKRSLSVHTSYRHNGTPKTAKNKIKKPSCR